MSHEIGVEFFHSWSDPHIIVDSNTDVTALTYDLLPVLNARFVRSVLCQKF